MTVQELITRALRLAGVLEAEETPTAAEQVDSLATFNDMLHAWALDGIYLDHTDLGWTDTLPYASEHLRAIRYALAVELCNDFNVDPKPAVVALAASAKADLVEDFFTVESVEVEVALQPDAGDGYNVVTDS